MVNRRCVVAVLMIWLFIAVFSVSVNASTAENEDRSDKIACEEEYRQMLESLPDDIRELLPEKLYSGNVTDIVEGASEMTDFSYVLNSALELAGLELEASLKMLATLVGILVLAATLNAVKSAFSSQSVLDAFSLASSCAVFLTATTAQYGIISSVAEFFQRICIFANAMLPLMGALYAMGGNVGGAVVNHTSLLMFMNIVENLCAGSVMPISGICLSFAAAGAISPGVNIGGLSKSFKKAYTGALTFIMTLFGTVLAAQNTLAAKADTLAGKTVKFAVGNMIPIVGSALSGTIGTLGTSIEYIRSGVGIVGVMAIVMMFLPTLITLLVSKLVLSLVSGISDVLGCDREGKIISEMSAINGFLLAAAGICSVTLVFMLTLFVKTSAAVGGGL